MTYTPNLRSNYGRAPSNPRNAGITSKGAAAPAVASAPATAGTANDRRADQSTKLIAATTTTISSAIATPTSAPSSSFSSSSSTLDGLDDHDLDGSTLIYYEDSFTTTVGADGESTYNAQYDSNPNSLRMMVLDTQPPAEPLPPQRRRTGPNPQGLVPSLRRNRRQRDGGL